LNDGKFEEPNRSCKKYRKRFGIREAAAGIRAAFGKRLLGSGKIIGGERMAPVDDQLSQRGEPESFPGKEVFGFKEIRLVKPGGAASEEAGNFYLQEDILMSTTFNLAPSRMEVLRTISPTGFDLFTKTMEQTKIDTVCIRDSQWVHNIDLNGYLHVDFTSILGPGLDLDFRITTDIKRGFKQLRGNKDVVIGLKNDNTYCFTNCMFSKEIDKLMGMEQDSLPAIKYPSEMIEIDEIEKLKEFTKAYNDVYLHIYDGEIGVVADDKGCWFYLEPEAFSEYQAVKPDMILVSRSFLDICGKHVKMGISKDGQLYWLITEIQMHDDFSIMVYENVIRIMN